MNAGCKRFVPLVVRSGDGTLAPGQQAELDAHVASCPSCRDALREQVVVSRLLGELELIPGPPDFAARVRARVAPQLGVIDLFNWRAWSLRLAPVAALLALLASYAALGGTAGQTSPSMIDEWAGARVDVADGLLIDPSANRDALLAVALEETLR